MKSTTFHIRFFSVLFIALFGILTSCGNEEDNRPLRERNQEVDMHFVLMDSIVNEYCNMVENLVEDAQSLEAKKEAGEETTLEDGLNMFSDMITSTMKIAELAEEVEKLEAKNPNFENELSSEDFKEFMNIYANMIKRFYDMAKRLEAHEKEVESSDSANSSTVDDVKDVLGKFGF